MIERFSEDVDILVSVQAPSLGMGSVDKILKEVCTRAGTALEIGPEDQEPVSDRGVKRDVVYMYPAQLRREEVSEGVKLEMGRRGGDFPHERRSLQSMIARHAIDTLGASRNDFDQFASFEIDVLAPERTWPRSWLSFIGSAWKRVARSWCGTAAISTTCTSCFRAKK